MLQPGDSWVQLQGVILWYILLWLEPHSQSSQLCTETTLKLPNEPSLLSNTPSWLHKSTHLIKGCSLVVAAKYYGCNHCLLSQSLFLLSSWGTFLHWQIIWFGDQPMAIPFLHWQTQLLTDSMHKHKAQRGRKPQQKQSLLGYKIVSFLHKFCSYDQITFGWK